MFLPDGPHFNFVRASSGCCRPIHCPGWVRDIAALFVTSCGPPHTCRKFDCRIKDAKLCTMSATASTLVFAVPRCQLGHIEKLESSLTCSCAFPLARNQRESREMLQHNRDVPSKHEWDLYNHSQHLELQRRLTYYWKLGPLKFSFISHIAAHIQLTVFWSHCIITV